MLGAAAPPRVAWEGRRGEGGGKDPDDDVSDQDQDDAEDDEVLGQHRALCSLSM